MKIPFTFFILIFSFFATSAAIASDLPKFDPPPDEVVYRGVTEEQWETISRIGDPLNCRQRVYDLQNLDFDEFYELKPEDCQNESCINDLLLKNNKILLREGIYETFPIKLFSKTILGYPNERIILNIKGNVGIDISYSNLANIIIQNAGDKGIDIGHKSFIYKVVVGNTGIHNKLSQRGIGFRLKEGSSAQDTCIVSAEAYNGYNYKSKYRFGYFGGAADGFDMKFSSAKNITFIDTHAHHNSDHGFDFFCSGNKDQEPVIRMYYSSAIKNKNPYKRGGDGGGIKIGGQLSDHECNFSDVRSSPRILYSTVACFNPGPDPNIHNPDAIKVKKINSSNDPHNLKCNDFSYIKKIKERSFDIAPLIDEETDSIINQGQFFDPEKDKNNTNLNDTELTEEIDNMFSNQLPE